MVVLPTMEIPLAYKVLGKVIFQFVCSQWGREGVPQSGPGLFAVSGSLSFLGRGQGTKSLVPGPFVGEGYPGQVLGQGTHPLGRTKTGVPHHTLLPARNRMTVPYPTLPRP